MYRLEMHAHTAGVSACAHITPAGLVARLADAGYHGVVVTNHVNDQTFRDMPDAPWRDKAARVYSGYADTLRAARGEIDVLFGCEINLAGAPNDYLVYGLTLERLIALGDPRGYDVKTLCARAHEAGMLVYQAHPMRFGSRLVNPADGLDGLEVFNGNRNHQSHNGFAAMWAKEMALRAISGSDFHDDVFVLNGGIETRERVRDNDQLLGALTRGDYRLIQA